MQKTKDRVLTICQRLLKRRQRTRLVVKAELYVEGMAKLRDGIAEFERHGFVVENLNIRDRNMFWFVAVVDFRKVQSVEFPVSQLADVVAGLKKKGGE